MIEVLCASLEGRPPLGLQHVGDHRLRMSRLEPWAVAANRLLDEAAATGNHALFIDDDVEILEGGLDVASEYLPFADVVGVGLLNYGPGVRLQMNGAGCYLSVGPDNQVVLTPRGDMARLLTPEYVPHVSASCMFLSANILKSGVRFPVWEGAHYEDVAFTLDAWLQGYKVAYVPGCVIHNLTPQGLGQQKAKDPHQMVKRAINERALHDWMKEANSAVEALAGTIPARGRPIRATDRRAS